MKNPVKYTTLNFSGNALETINLDRTDIHTLVLSNNHIGALDLSKTKAYSADLSGQTFYVSETLENVNLEDVFAGFDVDAVKEGKPLFDKKTGVLTLGTDKTTYTYVVNFDGAQVLPEMDVTLEAANPMNRLYNPNSGEHFYTADIKEKEALVALGWNDEGYGWVAPKSEAGHAVYRLYNPNAGDHHYTMSAEERDTLVAYGWKDEKTGWKSVDDVKSLANPTGVEVYRQYNPYANGAGSHNYTTDKAENDFLVSLGWTPEGIAWTALQ